MSSFVTNYVDVRIYRYAEKHELLNELEYVASDGFVYKIPVGFKTDFASIPRFLWNIIAPIGKHTNASILHDYLYAYGKSKYGLSRKQCDKLFYDALIDSHCNQLTSNIMWLCVRLFAFRKFVK